MLVPHSPPVRPLGWHSPIAALGVALATIALSIGARVLASSATNFAYVSTVGMAEFMMGGLVAILTVNGVRLARRPTEMATGKVIPATVGSLLLWYTGFLLIPATL